MFFTFCLLESLVFLYKVLFCPSHKASKPTEDSLRAQEIRMEDSLDFFRNVTTMEHFQNLFYIFSVKLQNTGVAKQSLTFPRK